MKTTYGVAEHTESEIGTPESEIGTPLPSLIRVPDDVPRDCDPRSRTHARRATLGLLVAADLAAAVAGTDVSPAWDRAGRPVDFYDLRGLVESYLNFLGLPPADFRNSSLPVFAGELGAELTWNGKVWGIMGGLSSDRRRMWGFKQEVMFLELDLEIIAAEKIQRLGLFLACELGPEIGVRPADQLVDGGAIGLGDGPVGQNELALAVPDEDKVGVDVYHLPEETQAPV